MVKWNVRWQSHLANRAGVKSGQMAIAIVAFFAIIGTTAYWANQLELVRKHYIETAKGDSRIVVGKIVANFAAIYQNIRTLSNLPSVRSVSRHGENLTEEAKVTIQQIYNNLISTVAVSEIYILPIDFEPDRIDMVTGQFESPIISFDQLIVGVQDNPKSEGPQTLTMAPMGRRDPLNESTLDRAGKAQVEIYEYRQMKRQLAWFAAHTPTAAAIDKLNVPMIGGEEIITCDNSKFDETGDDADRRGLIPAVPFFGADGRLRGGVAAIMRTARYCGMLPTGDFALVNSAVKFLAMTAQDGQAVRSSDWAISAKPDPSLVDRT